MTAEADVEDAPPKKSKLPLILGVVLALAGGGGGFYAVSSGLVLGGDSHAEDEEKPSELAEAEEAKPAGEALAFVPLEPIVVSLPSAQGSLLLRFRAQLEVLPENQEEVSQLSPRIIDVLNGYLRAVSLAELEDPTVLSRLRGQMLRRVQVVAGGDKVRDLLIMEFVLN